MAKALDNLAMFQSGDPSASPSSLMMTYDVVDGNAKETNKVHELAEPDHANKTVNQLWDDAVAAIKTAEGIA